MTTDASRARERFVAEGACGGEYAIVWDRERQQIVLPYLRTGASVSDDQIRAVAGELNALLAVERAEALKGALEHISDIRDRMQKSKDWPLIVGWINDLTELERELALMSGKVGI